jgi:hypothetical protein
MSDGLSDYYAAVDMAIYNNRHNLPLYDRPIVPRIAEHGRMMWAADLGLPSNNTPPYFWLGRDGEA